MLCISTKLSINTTLLFMIRLLALPCLFLFAGTLSLQAANPAVYPTPQKAVFSGEAVKVNRVTIVKRGDKSADELMSGIPEVSGAYRLIIKPGNATVAARDDRGLFYAKQTLSQLLRDVKGADFAQKDPFEGKTLEEVAALGELAACDISDWPDLANRGTVEGFYGTPWSHESRKKQIEFYGRNKMNTYIYGPKDDPYHSAQWRKPYPEKEAQQIRELVELSKKNHVDFVWAIHPGGSIKWNDEDMHNVIKKFELMYNLGVRSFSVFFDDIGGEGARGEKQAELLNLIQREFVLPKKDVTRLVMCPTQYNRSWSSGSYLSDLGRDLDPSIHIMWTGNTVVHDITLEGQEWVNRQIKRPSYVWWNFPVTDYKRNHLCLGRIYGLTQDDSAKDEMSGFVSNPMDKPEASKVALFGIADYTWNIKGFDSDPAWKNGIKRLFPECASEVQVFANHNSDLGPNGHGYRREESVDIAPVIKEYREAVKNSGKPPKTAEDRLIKEFAAITQAPAIIRSKSGSAAFIEETGTWLAVFEQLGHAGTAAMKAIKSMKPDDLVDATTALDEMKHLAKQEKSGAVTGTLVMTPFVMDITEVTAERIYNDISGRPSMKGTFIVQGGGTDNVDRLNDGNRNTYWHSGAYQKPGDWYGFEYNARVPLKSVEILMGKKDGDIDYVKKGQLEATQDMKKWIPLGSPTEGPHVFWKTNKPLQVRAIRYRILEPNKVSDGGNTVWTAIREFSINTPAPPLAASTVKGMAPLSVNQNDKLIGINRVMEISQMKKGDSITLTLPDPADATWLEIDLEQEDIPSWAEVSLTVEGSKKPVVQKLEPYQGKKFVSKGQQLPKGITSVTLTNKGHNARDIRINMFKLDVPPSDPGKNTFSLIDGNLMSVYRCDIPLNITIPNTDIPGASMVTVIGSASYKCQLQKKDGTWVNAPENKGEKMKQYLLPGIKGIRLINNSAQPGKSINEVVFSVK